MYMPYQSRRGLGACAFTPDPLDATHGIMTCSDPISGDLPPVGGTNAGTDATVTSTPIPANYFQPAVNPQASAMASYAPIAINPMWAVVGIGLLGLLIVLPGGRRR